MEGERKSALLLLLLLLRLRQPGCVLVLPCQARRLLALASLAHSLRQSRRVRCGAERWQRWCAGRQAGSPSPGQQASGEWRNCTWTSQDTARPQDSGLAQAGHSGQDGAGQSRSVCVFSLTGLSAGS